MNKVASAVRLTHNPSGIIVSCQTEREQRQNRETALKILRSKLWQRREESANEAQESFKTEKIAGWGRQIRSYVLHPYQLVKDHRINLEVRDIDGVLAGDIQKFLDACKDLD